MADGSPIDDPGAAAAAVPRIDLAATPDFDLGGVRVRPARRQLLASAGACHELEPRVMQVLVALSAAKGEVVSRDQLIDACWEGRIVGDDSLNRCVVALRRLAREIPSQPFTIETVPRVGYSLVERQAEGAAEPAPAPAANDAARPPRRRAVRMILAAVVVLCLAAAIVIALLGRDAAPADEPRPQLRLAALRSLSRNISPASAESAREELIAMFGLEDTVTLVDPDAPPPAAGPDLVLSGTLQSREDGFGFTMHISNRRTGASVWSHTFERPAPFNLAARQVAVLVTVAMQCGFVGAGNHLYRMTDQQLSLWLQYCSMVTGDSGASVDSVLHVTRRLTAAAPDFSNGWAARSLYAYPIGARPEEFAARRAEAAHAVEQALRINPRNGTAYLAKALSLPSGRFAQAEFERLMQRAISMPVQSGTEHQIYADFLVSLGRHEDALLHYTRAKDISRLPGIFSDGLAYAHFYTGRAEEGYRILDEAQALWPHDPALLRARVRAALWTGRYEEGLAALHHPALRYPSQVREALAAAFRALRSRSPEHRREALTLLRTTASDRRTNLSLVTSALATLGDHEAAISSASRNNAWMHGVLFWPSFAATRHQPAFVRLLDRLGMIRYWREVRRRPDFCNAANAPAFCRTL